MATDATPETPSSEIRLEVYDDYDAFLKQALREYYAQGWKSRKSHFIALVIASGQIVSMATDSVKDGTGLKKAAIGAAGVVALRFGLRYFLGPAGWLLGAAGIAAAVGYFLKNQKEIGARIGPMKTLVTDTRTKFEEIQGGYRAGRYDGAGRNLMVDGLLKRFLEQVEAT